MNVLMMCPQFRPLVGGYERAAERLSAELVRQGCGVTVIADRRDSRWPSEEALDGYEVRRLPCVYRAGWHSLTSLLSHAVWLLINGRRFDVWHVHQYGMHAALAVLLSRLLQRPVVLKMTSSANQGIGKSIAGAHLAGLVAWAHRRVNACIAVSTETAEEAVRFGIPRDRIILLGNGVNAELFRPTLPEMRAAMRAKLGLPNRPTAIFVGRLAEEKNPLGLLHAWALAHARFRTKWTLVMLGDGPMRRAVEERVRTSALKDSVVLAGSSTRVEEWLGAADLFVLSSHNEGMSNTALEALACGLPGVVTRVSGMQALVGDSLAGLVVPAGDMNSFADALVALHDCVDERAAMGHRAREKILNEYSIQTIAARHAEIYRRLRT